MADDNPTLAKRHCQRRAVMGWVAGKNEISGGWQDFEAKSDQSAAQPLTAFDHASTGLLKIGLILKRGDGAGLGGPANGIGIEAILHAG